MSLYAVSGKSLRPATENLNSCKEEKNYLKCYTTVSFLSFLHCYVTGASITTLMQELFLLSAEKLNFFSKLAAEKWAKSGLSVFDC